jgi:transposase
MERSSSTSRASSRLPCWTTGSHDPCRVAQGASDHPAIRIIARDRAGVYAEAATSGAPQAIQVADRFHLLKNLADTLLAVFEQHAKDLRDATRPSGESDLPPTTGAPAAPAVTEDLVRTLPPPTLSPKHQVRRSNDAQRDSLSMSARALHSQGWPIRTIGRDLGLNRTTVRSYIRATSFPERQPRVLRQPGVLDPYIPYLIERWNAGCRNGTALWKEIIEQGHTGKRVTVFSFITRLRKAPGIPAKNRTIRDGTVAVPDARPLTPRSAIWLVLQRPDQREDATIERIDKLREIHTELDAAITLMESFAELIRTRNPAALDPWLDQATASVLQPFHSFATSLRRDYNAVRAGVELEWSTGPVEGAINRLKMIKRTMFGRAGFPLLQRRVLLAS